MDQIQLSIKQVPTHVKTAMKLITSASNAMLKSMLPRTLESIGRLATESAQFANNTLLRFTQLQELLGEIIELSATTQSANEAAIDKMKEQKANGTLEQQRLKENLQMIQNQYQDSKTKLEAARKAYKEAMEAMANSTSPTIIQSGRSSKSLIGAAIAVVPALIQGVVCIFGGCKGPTYIVDNSKFENAMASAKLAKEELERA